MNINMTGVQDGTMDPNKRYFVKKWNEFIDDFVYKDKSSKEIMVPEDFMMLKLMEADNVVVLNESELPPQGYEMGSDGRARRSW